VERGKRVRSDKDNPYGKTAAVLDVRGQILVNG